MKLSDQRLSDILEQLQQGKAVAIATREEWLSIAAELRQLRLRTSPESRLAAAARNSSPPQQL